jgi:hypothetical protein
MQARTKIHSRFTDAGSERELTRAATAAHWASDLLRGPGAPARFIPKPCAFKRSRQTAPGSVSSSRRRWTRRLTLTPTRLARPASVNSTVLPPTGAPLNPLE